MGIAEAHCGARLKHVEEVLFCGTAPHCPGAWQVPDLYSVCIRSTWHVLILVNLLVPLVLPILHVVFPFCGNTGSRLDVWWGLLEDRATVSHSLVSLLWCS